MPRGGARMPQNGPDAPAPLCRDVPAELASRRAPRNYCRTRRTFGPFSGFDALPALGWSRSGCGALFCFLHDGEDGFTMHFSDSQTSPRSRQAMPRQR